MAGIGKTALALMLAEKLKDRFPDGQVILNLQGTSRSPMSLGEAMGQVIHAYHPTYRLPENQDELHGLYLSILAGKRSLLLFDNAANKEQVELLLPPASCAVLITSRIKFILPGLKGKDLDVLPEDKACELLLGITDRIGKHAKELAKLCGYLPLALRNAASVLAEKKDISVIEYEQRLRDKMERLELVKASFSLSFDLLPSIRKKQWCRLSVFPEDFDRDGAAAIWKMGPDLSVEALSDLVKWSLVDFIPNIDPERGGRHKLHDLARIFAETSVSPTEYADAQYRHAKHYTKVISESDGLYEKGGKNTLAGLELFDREWVNIKAGYAWVEGIIRTSMNSNKELKLKSALQLANSYQIEGSNVLGLRLHPKDQIHWLEIALIAVRRIKNRDDEGIHLSNLGSAYWHLGETRKAIEYYEQASKKFHEVGNWKGNGDNLGNLGCAYFELGEMHKAIEFFEQSLIIDRKAKDRMREGVCLSNLGDAYVVLGEIRTAIEYYERALKIAQEIENRMNEGIVLDDLGITYVDLGEAYKGIEYLEQALEIDREIGNRRDEGEALSDMGRAFTERGEVLKGIEYLELALRIDREIGNKREEGEALCYLGRAYSELGETYKAIDYCNQSLGIVRKIEYKSIECVALCSLGNAYADLGEPQKAIEYYDQSLDVIRNIEYHKIEGEALFNMSLALNELGQRQEAISHAKEAHAIFEKIESPKAEKVLEKLKEWQG